MSAADTGPTPPPVDERGPFARRYGRSPAHLIGHVVVIAISAYALSLMFQGRFAPQPLNLVLWLLGGAILHDAVFLPLYGVANALYARVVGADDGRSIRELAMGPVPAAATADADEGAAVDAAASSPVALPTSRDGSRAVPIVNHVRTPLVISAILFLVFLPRILNRQPQNFVNALGHPPPDFLGRWLLVTAVLFAGSAVVYAVRRARAQA